MINFSHIRHVVIRFNSINLIRCVCLKFIFKDTESSIEKHDENKNINEY